MIDSERKAEISASKCNFKFQSYEIIKIKKQVVMNITIWNLDGLGGLFDPPTWDLNPAVDPDLWKKLVIVEMRIST